MQEDKTTQKKTGLKKLDYFMLGFGSMVGVGWAVSSNHWLSQAGGPWPALIGFILGTLLLIPIGLAHGELMSSLPVGGGVMVYTYRAFGTGLSFISSWFVALAYLTILPWEAIYINRILGNLIPALRTGPVLYEIGGESIYLYGVLLGLVFTALLFWINYRGSEAAAKLQTLLSWSIIVIGILVIIVSFIKGEIRNLFPLYANIGTGQHGSLGTGILSMVVLVPFFMAGFDTIPQSVEEAHPKLTFKKIAKVLVMAIALAGIFYGLIIISTASVLPWGEYATYESPAMATMLLGAYGGSVGRILYVLVMLGTLAGLFSTWNGMFMASARLLQSMGNSGLLPEFFKKEHPKYKTPVGGAVFSLIATAAGPFLGLALIDPLTSLGSVAFVLGWLLTSLSALKLRKSEPDLKRSFEVPGGKATLVFAVLISAFIAAATFVPNQPAYMGNIGVVLFAAWLVLGGVFYYFTNFGERGMSEKERRRELFGKLRRLRKQKAAMTEN